MLKRKIIIKNKRLKPEEEKQALEKFKQGEFVIEDEVKEDASAPPAVAVAVEQQPVKVKVILILSFEHGSDPSTSTELSDRGFFW